MDFFSLAVIVLAIFVLYFATIIRLSGYFTANALFVYVQVVMAIGTYTLLDPHLSEDRIYGLVVTYSTVTYMLASGFLIAFGPLAATDGRDRQTVAVLQPRSGMWIAFWFATLITIAYFAFVGSSAFIDGLKNSFTGGSADIAGERFQAYSGTRYLAPGYVNQFKNALLPAIIVLILTYRASRGRLKVLSSLILVVWAVFALFGTGQRQPFIAFAAVLLVYLYCLSGGRFPRGTFKVLMSTLGAVLLATVALGRSETLRSAHIGVVDKFGSAFGELMQRAFQGQQAAGVFGWRYVRTLPVQDGKEWWTALTGILPSSRGSDLANRIYALHFGTTRGTDPPSIWVSIYHNFGWVGLAVAPFLLAALIVFVTQRGQMRGERNTLELLGIAGTSVCLGTWASSDPTYLLNVGIVVYLALWYLGARARRRSTVMADTTPPAAPRVPTPGGRTVVGTGGAT